jgi:AraC-like DNA-binding protein
LHSGGRCWRCTLTDAVEAALTNPETGGIHPSLLPLVVALAEMPRANSGLTWLRQPHVTAFLQRLSRASLTSHEELDAMPASRTREHVRGLLVEHGVLPRRDERAARFRDWSDTALTRLFDGPERDLMQRYIRWQLLRRMNQSDTVSESTFLRAKQNVTVAIDLINWLHSARGKTFTEVSQADLDAWQAEGPSTREFADRFLSWAVKTRVVSRDLQMTPHRRGTAPTLSAADQQQLIESVVVAPGSLSPRDRLLAILVLVFGQSVERVASLRWDQVTVSSQLVTVRLGKQDVALPPPLDEPVRHLANNPLHANTAAHPNSPWVFRGTKPGQHSSPAALRLRLRNTFASRAARLGTLHELTKTTPIAILADGLGYSPATLERLGVDAGQNFSRYVAVPRLRPL